MTPRLIGNYRLQAELGRGGMGIVYKAFDDSLRRFVALKTLSGALSYDDDIKARFAREARSMAGLIHPNVVAVHAIGDEQGAPFFVMEFVDGEPLSAVLKRHEPLSTLDAARIVHQAALGLGAAHRRGVVHRDIKPGNLLLSRQGVVKVADFGIARTLTGPDPKLTRPGEFMGTPGYLSPEACNGQPADARSDVFSLGIVLFECLTGRVPFSADSPLALMLSVVQADMPDVREINHDVDERLAGVLAKMVAKSPEGRYANGDEAAHALCQLPGVAHAPISVKIRAPVTKPLATSTPGNETIQIKATRMARRKNIAWSYPTETTTHRSRRWWPWIVGAGMFAASGAALVLR